MISIEIDRPPADVFAYATDPSRFPEWQRDVVAVGTDGDPLTVGTKFTTTRRFAGAKRSLVQEVSEVSPPHRWSARAIGGPIRPDATLVVDPINGGTRSRVTFTIEYRADGVGKVILPLVIRQTKGAVPTDAVLASGC
ncbi:MAG: SRPBCC family protein [Chloroflexota bacterium]